MCIAYDINKHLIKSGDKIKNVKTGAVEIVIDIEGELCFIGSKDIYPLEELKTEEFKIIKRGVVL